MKSANIKNDAGGKSRPAWPTDSKISAVFSECQKYRYQLREIWDESKPLVMWLRNSSHSHSVRNEEKIRLI